MIDKKRCHTYKLRDGVTIKDVTCSRCGHHMGIEDILLSPNACPFCGKYLKIDDTCYDEIAVETPDFGEILEVE